MGHTGTGPHGSSNDATIPVELTEDQRRERNEGHWLMALDGLDRAVAWIKANRQHLCSFHVNIEPSIKTGITINLGFHAEADRRAEAVATLFRGKRAEKRINDNGHSETFTVVDGGLQFRWSVWHFVEDEKPKIEEVVI